MEWKAQKIGAALQYRGSTYIAGIQTKMYMYGSTGIVVTEEEDLESGVTVTVSMRPTSGNPLPEYELNIILTGMGIDPDKPMEEYQVPHVPGNPTYYYRQTQDSWPA